MGGGSSNNDDDGMVSGINVTPLVDITLVLLIIMMVTAKIIVSQSLPMDLPKAAQGQQIQLVFGVELRQDGATLVDGKRIPNDDAVFPLAKEAFQKNNDLRAVIRADTAVQHGRCADRAPAVAGHPGPGRPAENARIPAGGAPVRHADHPRRFRRAPGVAAAGAT